MTRGDILKEAEKHCHLTAGWIFSVLEGLHET